MSPHRLFPQRHEQRDVKQVNIGIERQFAITFPKPRKTKNSPNQGEARPTQPCTKRSNLQSVANCPSQPESTCTNSVHLPVPFQHNTAKYVRTNVCTANITHVMSRHARIDISLIRTHSSPSAELSGLPHHAPPSLKSF